jgi:hypothetical protein
MKDEPRTSLNMRLTPAELAELQALGRVLKLDMTSTVRFLIGEKTRELASQIAAPGAAKKRRVAGE